MPLITPSSASPSSLTRWHCGGGWYSKAGRLRDFLDALLVLPLRSNARCQVVAETVPATVAAVRVKGARIAVRCPVFDAPVRGVFASMKEVGLSVVSMCLRALFHADQSGVELRACGPRKLSIRYAK